MSEDLDPVAEATLAQARAADPLYSVFVTANAGSGKTKVLVDRIARLLLEGSKPSAFLCITYTKAAAAEMQRRLFERLGAWCVADDATLAQELNKLGAPNANLGYARALFAQALETPGGLRIQTIHAFCERLLARFPLEAGVPPGFDIADEARAAALLGEARAAAALSEDGPRDAFRRFAKKLYSDHLEGLLDRLALRRADFHRYAQKHQGELFAARALRDRHGVTQTAEDFTRDFLARWRWDDLREATAKLCEGSVNDCRTGERLKAVLDCVARTDGAGAMQACFNFALNASGELRGSFATAATKKAHPWLEPLVRGLAEAAADARTTLNAIERAEDAVAALALALRLDEAYGEAKARAGALDFDDLIEHAQALLQRSEAAPWVLYKLDGGLDHILIDEGQDTSPAQWELITPLRDEFFAGLGAREKPRTVFSVGDPKQSIYGFQGADPARFLTEAQNLLARAEAAGANFVAPELRTSFRSAQQILDVVDETMRDKPLIEGPGAHDEVKHLAARAGEGGVVEVWPFTPRPEAQEALPWDAPMDVERETSAPAILAKEIAKRVKAMIETREAVWDKGELRPVQAGDVLALVRKRGAVFRELIKAFKRERLPVAGADRMILRDELVVQDCLALMQVALDPADDLALACVLKGPWCNLADDDNDIFPLAYDRGHTRLYDRLMQARDEKYASARAFVQELTARRGADAFAFLSWALETAHGGGPSGWKRVFSRLGAETRDPLEELLQRAARPSSHVAPTLQRFLYEIESDAGQIKRELEAETGAIRVMTVHGAKGLEAPVVILPDTTGDVGDAPDNGLLFDDEEGPFVSTSAKGDDKPCAEARAAHKKRALGEHWRLLYVAMTRARDRLIVCGPQWKSGEAPDVSWRAAVEEALGDLGATEIETPFGKGKRLGEIFIADARAAHVREAAALPAWALTPAPGAKRIEIAAPSRLHRVDPALFSPRGDGQKRFRRGRLIHGLLERLPEVAPAQRLKAARAWLERQGVDEDQADAFAREALAVIEDQRFAAVFGAKSRAEAPIVGDAGGRPVRGIVDRLVVDDERVIVLDFKTDRPSPTDVAKTPDAYVLQLALYREVLRKIFPGKTVSCALLWTETPHLMELPQARLDAVFETFRAS
ncbi:MAG TPA: double-strand break repair helicase AddA [Vitreimonas sp.]|uniref:double-strand break repair helicase AddA n=1 Tax=Vitreimonas sp. TaxID=3069702 RepID=UPI002D5B571B|nr:double-strand break repair helicase AddA [Vitreimonas sp.]HYD86410.1 double-strand break repair helicase AddA [Vitreimonas sp.]